MIKALVSNQHWFSSEPPILFLSRRFFFLWLPWPWAPLSQRLSPLLILTTATMALVITDMLVTPMPMALLSMARGLLKLPQLPNLPLILTTATTALATTVMLATPTPMVVTTMESKKE